MAQTQLPNLSALALTPTGMMPERQSGTWSVEKEPAAKPNAQPCDKEPCCDKETDDNPDCECPKCEADRRDAAEDALYARGES